jgi:glycosyltransferase involved in cell wall biosynthesis
MAAGRIVIGSSAGGMAEVIEHGVSGLLVSPRSPKEITEAVLALASDPAWARSLAAAGRQRVLDLLSPQRVLPLQLASYQRAMARAASS